MRRVLVAVLGVAALLAPAAPAAAQSEAERLRTAKALYFDHRYDEAREAWRALQSSPAQASAAAYWVARCSESLGESERALREYQAFLSAAPSDSLLVEEAKTSRVGLAAQLYRDGEKRYLPVLQKALGDDSRTVRYYAALKLGGLGPEVGRASIPVLKQIIAEEKDPDLVDRARLAILRLDPASLDQGGRSKPKGKKAKWVRLEIRDAEDDEPSVSLSVPVALARLVFKSLPDDAQQELAREGIDAANFWDRLEELGPTQILEIKGDNGELIKLWLE